MFKNMTRVNILKVLNNKIFFLNIIKIKIFGISAFKKYTTKFVIFKSVIFFNSKKSNFYLKTIFYCFKYIHLL